MPDIPDYEFLASEPAQWHNGKCLLPDGVGIKITVLCDDSNVNSIQHHSNKNKQGESAICVFTFTAEISKLHSCMESHFLQINPMCIGQILIGLCNAA